MKLKVGKTERFYHVWAAVIEGLSSQNIKHSIVNVLRLEIQKWFYSSTEASMRIACIKIRDPKVVLQ